jgi:polygalacturonase
MSGGVTNLTVSQCLFRGTDRGLRIKTRRGRGKDGIIDGIVFENIRMERVLTPLVINMFYFCDPDGKSDYAQSKTALPADDRTPYIGRFTFRNMECTDCEYAAGFFYGLPERPIDSVTIENVSFHMASDADGGLPAMMCDIEPHTRRGLVFNNVREVILSGVSFKGVDGDEVEANNVERQEIQ